MGKTWRPDRNLRGLYEDIKCARAQMRCECEGECGANHQFGVNYRCPNKHGNMPPKGRQEAVSLTVSHLDGNERNNDLSNLIALCQQCLARHRANTKKAAKRKAEREAIEAQHVGALFDLPEMATATAGANEL
ncbi:hypothetical protein NJBCHELONAE_48720 [Mycobacteroides chelonae]|uniref:hypothetical protein n=1 Tax=Mycobacteroides chelonae TaxID=1774 RepID=UPI0021DE1664|nr:hypothetical protein [Mycobacteroides chelonae]GLE59559.1 hypothetical protein NJBCHELONAE_48720 [Mycobacteroides chelonae]